MSTQAVVVSPEAATALRREVTVELKLAFDPDADRLTADLPDLDPTDLAHLDDDGVARIGTHVDGGMVLIGRLVPLRNAPTGEAAAALDAAFGVPEGRDASLRCPHDLRGVIERITMEDTGTSSAPQRTISVFVKSAHPLAVGDLLTPGSDPARRAVVTAIEPLPGHARFSLPDFERDAAVERLSPFAEQVMHARSIGPYSSVTQQPLGSKSQRGGQRITTTQLDALLERGARHTVQELMTVKCDSLDGRAKLFESIVRSAPKVTPTLPFRMKALERTLQSMGLDLDLSWNRPRLSLLSPVALKELAPGVVAKPETLNYRTMKPERGGLFCEEVFGALDTPARATQLGRVALASPVVHPFAYEVLAKLLGLPLERFLKVLRGEEALSGGEPATFKDTGALALREAASQVSLDAPPPEAASIAATMKERSLSAASFFFDEWPVMPPGLRPLIPLDQHRFATSDLNDFYRRVINRNNRLRRLIELDAPVIILINEVRMLQEAIESLVDNGRPERTITGPNHQPLVSLIEHLNGTLGFLWTLDRTVDFSGVARAVPVPEDGVLEVPRAMARVLLEPWAWAWLEQHGHVKTVKEAKLLTREQSALGEQALDAVMASVTLLLVNPRTDRVAGAAVCRSWQHPALGVGGALARQLELEPGDELVVHVPCGAEAIAEVKALEHGRPVPSLDAGWVARARTACLESNDALSTVLLNAALAGEQDELVNRRTVAQLGRLPKAE